MLKVRVRVSNLIGEAERALKAIAFSDDACLDKMRKNYFNGTAIITFYVKKDSYTSLIELMRTYMYGDRIDVISKRKTLRKFSKRISDRLVASV